MENEHTCCTQDDTTREGTSTLTRFLRMLDPVNAPLDPRNSMDLLVFAKHYADLLRFYDMDDSVNCVEAGADDPKTQNANTSQEQSKKELVPVRQDQKKLPENKKPLITWKEFFYSDIAVVVASISQYERKLLLIKKEYDALREEVELDTTKENFRELFYCIVHHLKRIQRWQERSIDGHPLKNELEIKIKSFLAPALKKLIAYDKGMLASMQFDFRMTGQYESFKAEPWNCDYTQPDFDASIYVGDTTKKKIIYALMYVDDIFNTLYKSYEEITGRSGYYWQKAIEDYPSHQPHMALFISFVELFGHARNELNTLTKRHLDFLYRDVLHLTEKPAKPDSVYLIYQLAKGIDEYDLKQGTELTAGKDAIGKQLLYNTDKELVINKASVKELKTVFLDKDNSIKNIYTAPVANSADGKGEKFANAETAWSTFGYFEPQKSGNTITGEKAQFGFAFATPQLNLSQSDRTIDIKIYFKNPDGRNDRIKLTSDDFEIYFSGEKDWISPLVETETEELQVGSSKKKIAVPVVFRDRLINFLNSPDLSTRKIAPPEHSLGPIFDNAALGSADGKDDYDLDKTAESLVSKRELLKGRFTALSEIYEKDKIGEDKINDLIYSFSNKIAVADNTDHVLFFRTRIQPQQESITSAGKEFKNFTFKTQNPVCKIVFKQDSEIYESLKDIMVAKVEINVAVEGLKDIIVENDDGPIDPQKDFYPFTARPSAGSSVMFGAKEFENKNIDLFSANVEWKGEYNFNQRYMGYVDFNDYPGENSIPENNPRKNYTNYQGNVEVFIKNNWDHPSLKKRDTIGMANMVERVDVTNRIHLFESDKGGTAKWNAFPFLIDGDNRFYSQSVASNNYKLLKVVLGRNDFGHELYPTLITQYLAKRKKIVKDDKNKGDFIVVNCGENDHDIFIPSTPAEIKIKSISFDYISSQTLDPSNSQFFHLYPFGEAEVFCEPDSDFPFTFNETNFDKLLETEKETSQLIIPARYLLPQFRNGSDSAVTEMLKNLNAQVLLRHKEFNSRKYFQLNQYFSLFQQQGNLYIGIENLSPPQNLSLLFKFADGTAYDNDSEPPKINWSYLVNNEWMPLPQDHLISDSTYGFQTAGIVLIDFPADATNDNTLLTTGLHWLCASIDKNGDRIPKLIDVIAQANQATFSDHHNDPAHYLSPLPEKSISKPFVKIPEVKVIDQPFESFDGKPREEGIQFYQRVSERLRHKGRAITPHDYEHLVLEQFPSVYKVRVLVHNDPECICRHENPDNTLPNDCCCPQVAPGHVLIVPVSNLRNKNAVDTLKPRTGRRTLLKIEKFLQKRVSPFVKVHAKNPKFEEVKLGFSVKFYTGIDKGFYKRKLNEDLVHYLTPWAFDSTFEVFFGNSIYASKIINFIEELEYVNYLTCFRMIHIVKGCCEADSLVELDCDEMQMPVSKDNIPGRFLTEVVATSPQAILVSARQHCIRLIEEEPAVDNCHCS